MNTYPRVVDAERAEWPSESWLRRTRFTGGVTLFVVAALLIIFVPGAADWLSGLLVLLAWLWYLLPVLLRSGRTFVEGYRTSP
jgi:hypothetical protein